MKWFKHDANAILDSKLKKLRLKYGMEGYGVYWYCLECIARNVEAHNLSFELEEDSELIAADTNIHRERVEEMMKYMVDLRLFEIANGIVTCIAMRSRTDEYTSKLLKGNQPLISCPDSVPTKSALLDKNRIDKNRIDNSVDVENCFAVFWDKYPKKVDKKKSRARYAKLIKQHEAIMEGLNKHILSEQWQKEGGKYIPYPATWLNGERWNDELTPHLKVVSDNRKLL